MKKEYPFSQLVEGGLRELLLTARCLVHLGAELLTHPWVGSLKLPQNPFRTVILRKKGELSPDPYSLWVLESTMQKYAALEEVKGAANTFLTSQMASDLQFMDLDLIKGAIEALKL